jgi:hypothetical protein
MRHSLLFYFPLLQIMIASMELARVKDKCIHMTWNMVMKTYMMHHTKWTLSTVIHLLTIQTFASKFTPRPGMKNKVRMPKDKNGLE